MEGAHRFRSEAEEALAPRTRLAGSALPHPATRVSVSTVVSGGLNVGWRLPRPMASFVPGSWAALTRATTLPVFGLPGCCPFFPLPLTGLWKEGCRI